jgi:hypothetical protein
MSARSSVHSHNVRFMCVRNDDAAKRQRRAPAAVRPVRVRVGVTEQRQQQHGAQQQQRRRATLGR